MLCAVATRMISHIVAGAVTLIAGLVVVGATHVASAAEPAESPRLRMINPCTTTWVMGVEVRARGAPVTGIVASLPVCMPWPEQDIKVLRTDRSPAVRSVRFREIDDGVRQMIVTIPRLVAGAEAHALITVRVTKRDLVAPDETGDLRTVKRVDRSLQKYLRPSPYIESQDTKIRQIAAQITQPYDQDWEKVQAIYDWVRAHVEYRFAEQIKKARQALDDGFGDCEELSSLIIAMCRDVNIPARLVWVPGHCYPEFYLTDAQGAGYWFPCQAAGTRSFGAISEARPILQKGDNFRVPGQRAPQRYVHESLSAKNAPVPPEVRFIRRQIDPPANHSPAESASTPGRGIQ